jgi:hypothetical protein
LKNPFLFPIRKNGKTLRSALLFFLKKSGTEVIQTARSIPLDFSDFDQTFYVFLLEEPSYINFF